MDRFTRNYSLLLGAILIAALFFWAKSTWKPEVWNLGEVLTSDPQLAELPLSVPAARLSLMAWP
jgi:hypothetical protein